MDRVLKGMLDGNVPSADRSTTADAFFLDRAMGLAWGGAGRVAPNPLVGAVVVRDGRVVSEGYHAAYGREHAETAALDRAGDAAAGSTLYVTLEPCTHFGKTPPCIDRIRASGVARVVVSTRDPDPRMNGAGIAALREAGIRVDVGCRAERAIALNLPYFKKMLHLGPAVTLKMATTLDGRIAAAPGSRDDISGQEARQFVHRLRAANDGVMIGIETLLVDQPRLDCRLLDGTILPVPVVLDTRLRFPEDYPWCDAGRRFVVIAGEQVESNKRQTIERGGGEVVLCPLVRGKVDLSSAFESLGTRGVDSILVEGGATVFTSFLREGVWDVMHLFVSPVVFGAQGVGLSELPIGRDGVDAVLAGVTPFSEDVMISYLSERTRSSFLKALVG